MSASATQTVRPLRRRWGRFSPSASLTILALLAVGVVVLFMTLEARGSWSFIIPFRGRKVLGMAADELPGPPVQLRRETGGRLTMTMTLLRYEPGQ